jgi:hypothetical protein
VLVAGAILGADRHKQVLRMGLRGPWRERFAALLKRISELARSTVAQFTCYEENPTLIANYLLMYGLLEHHPIT